VGIFKSIRRVRRLLFLLLFLVAASVGYYFLPDSFHAPLKEWSPKWDYRLKKRGFALAQGIDSLGLWGRDCRVELDRKDLAGTYAYAGFPRSKKRLKILKNQGYVVGYSEKLRDPIWVAYRVFDVKKLESGKRPSRFRVDSRTRSKVSHDDYTGSGFDRGHMAPNYAIATRFGTEGQRETFLMSNIIPQTPKVNQQIWRELEMWVAKRYGRYLEEVWVVTGPIFTPPIRRLSSGVAIPSAYYKIIVDEKDGGVRALAFLIKADCSPLTRLKTRLVSIDEIEKDTGLDFFPEMSSVEQQALEATPAKRLWPWLGEALRNH
jgi:endonuclease G